MREFFFLFSKFYSSITKKGNNLGKIPIYEDLPVLFKGNAVKKIESSQIQILDPTGERTLLFSKKNSNSARPGDILQVESYNALPNKSNISIFSGYLIAVHRKGINTSFRLRNHIFKTGVEIKFNLYSPAIKSIKILLKKAIGRVRRAKLYYLRQLKHNPGPVENLLKQKEKQCKTN
ncbi:ribosomal protein L19 [Pneumocystis carinii B80]|uniref:Ribosomal protein L19 n=1 Tax=Pneumocystis carinii (strain B80) TaxID=1408658 RepID=A0A0W4ZN34_PNEC8|nr:ribosomal protein L19 [Pneumocystis carinii B80]KTW29778.1 ribosomal protein L19 [Pneumocystis carinii B80]